MLKPDRRHGAAFHTPGALPPKPRQRARERGITSNIDTRPQHPPPPPRVSLCPLLLALRDPGQSPSSLRRVRRVVAAGTAVGPMRVASVVCALPFALSSGAVAGAAGVVPRGFPSAAPDSHPVLPLQAASRHRCPFGPEAGVRCPVACEWGPIVGLLGPWLTPSGAFLCVWGPVSPPPNSRTPCVCMAMGRARGMRRCGEAGCTRVVLEERRGGVWKPKFCARNIAQINTSGSWGGGE